MRALLYDTSKAPHLMRFHADAPKPVFNKEKDKVLVSVKAACLNPVDYKLPSFPIYGRTLSRPVGLDFSGVVVEAGENSLGLKPGDEVFGQAKSGTLCEYTIADVGAITRKPAGIRHVEAASAGVVTITTLQSLRDAGKIREGSRVLVIGASGGCGTIGVQMAKALGASHVTGVCSSRNVDFVKSLGADEIHAYDAGQGPLPSIRPENLAANGFDVVYDTVTSPDDHNYECEARKLLRENGQYVQINASAMRWILSGIKMSIGLNLFPKNVHLVLASCNTQDLNLVAELLESKKVVIGVEKEYPLTEEATNAAVEALKGRRTRGKLAIVP